MTQKNAAIDSLLVNINQAAKLIGVGRTLFYSMHTNGQLGPSPVRFGRRILWRVDELTRWVQAGCPKRQEWIKNKQK